MPPIRFRIRTIMIAIAVVAVLMGFLRLPGEVQTGVEVIVFLALIVGVFAEFEVRVKTTYYEPKKRDALKIKNRADVGGECRSRVGSQAAHRIIRRVIRRA
jgi:hypothetical protein